MFPAGPPANPPHDEPGQVFWWLVRLRWVAVLGVVATLVLAGPVLGRLPEGTAPWLWAVAGALGGFNGALTLRGPGAVWSHLPGQIVVDCLALAAFVHLAGGLDNPFLPLFVLHVVNAHIALGRGTAQLVLALTIALDAAIVLGEGLGLLPHHCLRPNPALCSGQALDLWGLAVLGALVLTLVASSQFTRFLTAKLRLNQQRLTATVAELNQEKQVLADAQATVEHERTRLQAIIDSMGNAVTLVGPAGDVLFSNERARALWGAGVPGAIDLTASDARGPVTVEHAERTFEVRASPVRARHGQALGMVVVAHDITERLAMERHLMQEERMSVLGKLAAAVAHEINNPIGVVSLYSQHALAKSSPDSPIYKHLETIRRNADDCARITRDLLNLARPLAPERRPVDLRQLCREVVESVQPLAAHAGVRLACQSHAGDVALWAWADAGMLQQALLNLALNAVEATGEGDEVSIGAWETQDGGASASVVEVRDTGAGMSATQLKQVFQPFFTTKPSGTGLGLSVADTIVKSHAGRIDVESTLEVGTVFRIVLPDLAQVAAPASPALGVSGEGEHGA